MSLFVFSLIVSCFYFLYYDKISLRQHLLGNLALISGMAESWLALRDLGGIFTSIFLAPWRGAFRALVNIPPGAQKASQDSAIPLIKTRLPNKCCRRESFFVMHKVKGTHIPPFNQWESFPAKESLGFVLRFKPCNF